MAFALVTNEFSDVRDKLHTMIRVTPFVHTLAFDFQLVTSIIIYP